MKKRTTECRTQVGRTEKNHISIQYLDNHANTYLKCDEVEAMTTRLSINAMTLFLPP